MSNAITDVFSGAPNLSTKERAISVVVGLGLAAAAAQPRPNKWLSLAVLVGGSLLAIRGATGHCAAKALMDGQTSLLDHQARDPRHVF